MWDSVIRTTLVSDILTYSWLSFETLSSILISLSVFVMHLSKQHTVWISFSVKFPVLLQLSPISKLGHNWPTFMLKQLINSLPGTYSSCFSELLGQWCWWSHKTLQFFPRHLWILFMSAAFAQYGVSLQWKKSLQWMKGQSRNTWSKGAFPQHAGSTWQLYTNWLEGMMGITFPRLGQIYFRNSELVSCSSTSETTPWSLVMVSWAWVLNSGRRGEFLLSGWPDYTAFPKAGRFTFFFHLRAHAVLWVGRSSAYPETLTRSEHWASSDLFS